MRIFRRSTELFVREAKPLAHYTLLDFVHGYVYGRWPYLYIGIATGEHRLARWVLPLIAFFRSFFRSDRGTSLQRGPAPGDGAKARFADGYHGKVVPLRAATRLVTVNADITVTAPEQVIPYATARDIVLRHPDHIAVLQCPCRTARRNPCTPLDVCLIVGEPFAGFMLEHHPQRARRMTPAEAVAILRAEDARGHVHHAFFKDAMLGRFYAICNCCACCCGAMQAHRNGTPMLASSGYVAGVDPELCIGCGTCTKYCQFHAVSIVDGKKSIDEAACMGCGVCVPRCPRNAISLVRSPSRGAPLELDTLMAEAMAHGPKGGSLHVSAE
jgi:ferredoxin